ncbi:MAG: PhnD/SsuA/transferrin family substrate-binding protein [Myxococcales bacterium]|nr:PhnD/SsuA/transferrin family substrate-binding protein [Myxococcales bacterium]
MRARATLRGVLATLALLFALGAAGAHAADTTLRVALLLPNGALGGPYKQAAYGKTLASKLGAALGRPARALVFATAAQLDRAIAGGRIDIAVVDPLYYTTHRKRHALRAIAIATHRGATSRRWGLYSKSTTSASLLGKTIAIARSGGPDLDFVARVLFAGVAPLDRLFSRVRRVRTASNAIAAVKFGQADCAVAPVADHGLELRVGLGRFINPIMVAVRRSLDLPAARRAALATKLPGAVFDGWHAVGVETTRALARLEKPLLAPRLVADAPLLSAGAVRRLDRRDMRLAPSTLAGYLGRRR